KQNRQAKHDVKSAVALTCFHPGASHFLRLCSPPPRLLWLRQILISDPPSGRESVFTVVFQFQAHNKQEDHKQRTDFKLCDQCFNGETDCFP
ncbi:hypothetical protein BaRGS_00001790, partial [Batillaria attramentaria]